MVDPTLCSGEFNQMMKTLNFTKERRKESTSEQIRNEHMKMILCQPEFAQMISQTLVLHAKQFGGFTWDDICSLSTIAEWLFHDHHLCLHQWLCFPFFIMCLTNTEIGESVTKKNMMFNYTQSHPRQRISLHAPEQVTGKKKTTSPSSLYDLELDLRMQTLLANELVVFRDPQSLQQCFMSSWCWSS